MKKITKFKSSEYLLLKVGKIFDVINGKDLTADILIQFG